MGFEWGWPPVANLVVNLADLKVAERERRRASVKAELSANYLAVGSADLLGMWSSGTRWVANLVSCWAL